MINFSEKNQIRVLFSRNHDIVLPKLGVFLGGPTPPDGQMINGWRRKIIESLKEEKELNASMIVVAPEPECGNWTGIDNLNPANELELVHDKQMVWELQYLNLCDITAFWLPTYWNKETAGIFSANIGPTSRFEFGFFFQEYLKNSKKDILLLVAQKMLKVLNGQKKLQRFMVLNGTF